LTGASPSRAKIKRAKTKRSFWFWLCIAYLIATVSYNVWLAGWSLLDTHAADQPWLAINLSCKITAIFFLLFRRVECVYLLLIAFVSGLSATLRDYYFSQSWEALPLVFKIGRINGFVISLAIIFYLAFMFRRDFSVSGKKFSDTP
jgi:hypothetical protein